MPLDDELVRLIRGRALCFVSTLMPDGSPQVTETWVDAAGDLVLVNTVQTHQKIRNVTRDPRISLAVADPENPSRYVELRGVVTAQRLEGAADHIELLSQRYLGRPYPGWGRSDQVRVILEIAVHRIVGRR